MQQILIVTISIINGKQFQAVILMNPPTMNSHGHVQRELLMKYVLLVIKVVDLL